MKNLLFISLFIFSYSVLNAQQWDGSSSTSNDIYRTGNVGIGTTGAAYPLIVTHPYYPISTTGTNYKIASEIGIYNTYVIPAGITENGYRMGLNINAHLRDANFLGILNQQIGIRIQYGTYTGSGTGTIVNSYGLYLQALESGSATITNKYGIYQTGTNFKNYFAGNIGIGTISPNMPLHIFGSADGSNVNLLKLQNGAGQTVGSEVGIYFAPTNATTGRGAKITGYQAGNNQIGLKFYVGAASDAATEAMYINSSGNIGIGTSTPVGKLQVESTGLDNIFSIRRNASPQTNTFDFRITSTPKGILALNDGSLTIMPTEKDADIAFLTKDVTLASATPQFIIKKDGKVLIGKTAPNAGTDYLLDVAGKVRANEIVVNTDGADFVFEKDYKLRSLAELEQFVKTNKHLPGIAPATDMQQNGVSVSEMQTKLLQKVEELTLYVIEQQKEIESLKAKLENKIQK